MTKYNVLLPIFLVSAAAVTAVIVQNTPSTRLIPADVLRDYRSNCFAATQCKVYEVGDTWPLTPYCGESRCVNIKSTNQRTGKSFTSLFENVTDCGPVIDLDKTPSCQLVQEQYDVEDPFPGCCPVYDCDQEAEVFFIATASTDEKGRPKQKTN